MKKKIVIALLLVSTFSLIGCSKSFVEKKPVVVNDTQKGITSIITGTPTASASDQRSDQSKNSTEDTTDNMDYQSSEAVDTTEGSATKNNSSTSSDETFPYTIELEGTKETINGKKYQSKLGYQMLYDADRYTITSEDGIDSYMAPNSDPILYPYLYLNVSRSELPTELKTEKSDSEHPDFIKVTDSIGNFSGYIAYDYTKLVPEYKDSIIVNDGSSSSKYPVDTVKVGDYNAVHYTTTSGSEWNSSITEFFFITTDKYIYTLTSNYYTEATEGCAGRFRAMIDTFKIQ